MLENEDSVVTSLNELRKLKHERITRQTQTRAVAGSGRAAALAVDPAADQMTPPPQGVPSLASLKGPASFGQHAAQGGYAGLDTAPSMGFVAPMAAPPVIQVKTSYKAAVIMTLLLLGVGGAGYVVLQNDMQAQLAEKDTKIKRVEEERALAAGVAAKADVQAKNNLRQCEDKLKTALAAAVPAAPPVLEPPSAPAVEKKSAAAKPAKFASRATKSRASRASRRSAADSAAPKGADVPTIAKKKKLDNDPLAGLGKL